MRVNTEIKSGAYNKNLTNEKDETTNTNKFKDYWITKKLVIKSKDSDIKLR